MAPEYLRELVSIRKSSRKLRCYCSCQCLVGSSDMVIVRLVLQPPLCGIGCRKILKMRRLLKILNPSWNTPVPGCFHS